MVNQSVLAAAKEDPTPPPAKKTKVMEIDNVESMRKKREAKVSSRYLKLFLRFGSLNLGINLKRIITQLYI